MSLSKSIYEVSKGNICNDLQLIVLLKAIYTYKNSSYTKLYETMFTNVIGILFIILTADALKMQIAISSGGRYRLTCKIDTRHIIVLFWVEFNFLLHFNIFHNLR